MNIRDLTLRSLPEQVRDRVSGSLVDAGIAVEARGALVESRRGLLELRTADDGSVSMAGYATTWGTSYDVYGGPERGGWTETIAAGAATKTLQERDDVRFLVNHEGLPLARTKSGTLRLSSDEMGLLCEVMGLDMENPCACELVSAMKRGDVDQMSWAFQVIRQEWNGDYTERLIIEAKAFDVSAVTYPANPATIIGLRSETEPSRMSLRLAQAQFDALLLA